MPNCANGYPTKEQNKEYYWQNKEMINQKCKQYYQKNREQRLAYFKTKKHCELCDVDVNTNHWSRHLKTKKHKNNFDDWIWD